MDFAGLSPIPFENVFHLGFLVNGPGIMMELPAMRCDMTIGEGQVCAIAVSVSSEINPRKFVGIGSGPPWIGDSEATVVDAEFVFVNKHPSSAGRRVNDAREFF